MDKKLALALAGLVMGIIAVALLFMQPGSLNMTAKSGLIISNFNFSEVSTGPDKQQITTLPGNIMFEGPITKPTPCNGLNASYGVKGSTVVVDIETTPYKGFCIQVIKDTFYKGSFEYNGTLSEIMINYSGQELASAKL